MVRRDVSGLAGTNSEKRRRHRKRILGVLRGICVKIEHLQTSDDARLACRDVARMLSRAGAGEQPVAVAKKAR
jgi:hypothetical protein